jgi:hypothetical protein
MKKFILPIGIFMGFSFLGYREYRVLHQPLPQLVVEKNLVLLRATPEIVFGMGRLDSSRAKALFRGMVSFFSARELLPFSDISVGEERNEISFSVQRISTNLTRGVCGGQVMWFIGDDFDNEEEQQLAVQSGVDFESDWWIMTKNRLPSFLPFPAQGILYAGDRSPSQKTTTFAQDKKIPLISASETNGFLLSFVDGEWKLNLRN